MAEPIDFADLSAALLDRAEQLVPMWLPGGTQRGREYLCADLGGGAGTSCSVNLKTGRWADFSGDERGGDLISLYAASRGLSQAQAARELMHDLGWERAAAAAAPPQVPARQAAAAVAVPADGAQPSARRNSYWQPISPVPKGTPAPDFVHWHHGAATRWWAYERGGELYGYVCRFDKPDGRKDVLPLTWCVDESDGRGTRRWHWKQWDEPRPLYLPAGALAADGRPVVLVEGEKCAQAGHGLLGCEFDFVSWPGGGKAWSRADWSWLRGRTVHLWPDCDAKHERLTSAEREAGLDPASKPVLPESRQPGVQAMAGVGARLAAELGCEVRMCVLPQPGVVTDGWDVADAIESGWDAAAVRAFIRSARPLVQEAAAAEQKRVSTPPPAGASHGGGGSERGPSWRRALLITDKGCVKVCRENVVLALDGLLLSDDGEPLERLPGIGAVQGVVAYNEFTNDLMKLRAAPWGSPAGIWEEVDELLMGEWLVRNHELPSMPRGTLEEAVRVVAYHHRYHPVREYLTGLVWDGEPRLATWLRRAVMEEDEYDPRDALQRYLARVGTWFLQGMCSRAMRPGVKFDYMLILEGAQGMRKSTLLATLAGDWFADTGLVLGEKDSYQQLQGRWLYEFPELDAFSKADVTKIKAFVASTSDYFRASFDKRARDYPRQLVFGGSTNEDHYLTDLTGNRRFWPVRVTRQIDIDWVREVRDQLFAEAMHRIATGARMYPTREEEIELFEPQQRQRAVENAIESAIGRWLTDNADGQLCNEVGLVELLGKIGIGVEKLGPGRFHEKQAAAALRRLGWAESRSSRPGRPRVYRRPENAPQGGNSTTPTQGNEDGGLNGCPF